MDTTFAAPRTHERADDLLGDALERVGSFGRIGQVADAQGARDFGGSEQGGGHGELLGVEPPTAARHCEGAYPGPATP